MTGDVITAVERLQGLSNRYFACDPYKTDCIDLALDAILRNPDKKGDPSCLVRNALGDARKTMRRHYRIHPIEPFGDEESYSRFVEDAPDKSHFNSQSRIDIIDWINNLPLGLIDKSILRILTCGGDAIDVATRHHFTYSQAQVRVSRAKARARQLWKKEFVSG